MDTLASGRRGRLRNYSEPRDSRLVIMAPSGSEVYVDDERYGSVGRSGRVILSSIAPGKHVLRVSKSGEPDDERVIEIRSDMAEQIIEAQLKIGVSSNQLTPSRGGSLDSRSGGNSTTLVVVMCTRCQARFAEGVKFCGRCGNTTFQAVTGELPAPSPPTPAPAASGVTCRVADTVIRQVSSFVDDAAFLSERQRWTGARQNLWKCSASVAERAIREEQNLRPLWQTDSLLRELQLSFNLAPDT